MRRFARLLLLTALPLFALPLTGCSAVKLAYSYADTLIRAWIDRYIDLDDDQERLARERIDHFLDWHKHTMLPRYASFLRREAEIHESRKFSAVTYAETKQLGEQLYEDTARGAIGDIAMVLASIRPEQLDYTKKQMAKYGDELREKFARPLVDQIDERVAQTEDTCETLVGDLEPAQKVLIRRAAEHLYMRPDLWLQNRDRRAQAFFGLIDKHPTEAMLAGFLEQWTIRYQELQTPEYRVYAADQRRQIEQLIFELLQSLTDKQRAHFVDTLRSYADQLTDLMS